MGQPLRKRTQFWPRRKSSLFPTFSPTRAASRCPISNGCRTAKGIFWNEQLVNGRLEEIMVNSFRDVVSFAEKHQVHNRLAAYMLAIDRVASALQTRGLYA